MSSGFVRRASDLRVVTIPIVLLHEQPHMQSALGLKEPVGPTRQNRQLHGSENLRVLRAHLDPRQFPGLINRVIHPPRRVSKVVTLGQIRQTLCESRPERIDSLSTVSYTH